MKLQVVSNLSGAIQSEELDLPEASTVQQALAVSTWAQAAKSQSHAVALWGKRVALTHRLTDGDRLELLAPLIADPKQVRRMRAELSREALLQKRQAARRVVKRNP
jgi:putative ubiquitin-RnfH superfamily antitoxin RatB of RatAB toxin-antitoxin module